MVLPDQTEAVLLGAAVLGARASQDYGNIQVKRQTQTFYTNIFILYESFTAFIVCNHNDVTHNGFAL